MLGTMRTVINDSDENPQKYCNAKQCNEPRCVYRKKIQRRVKKGEGEGQRTKRDVDASIFVELVNSGAQNAETNKKKND